MDFNQWPVLVGDLFAKLSRAVSAYFPNLLGAALLLAAGWLVAKLLRFIASRFLRRLHRLIPGRALGREIKSSGFDRLTTDLVSTVIFWAVFLFFVAAATEALGLSAVTSGLGRLAGYLPAVLASVLILLSGLVLGNLAQSVVTRAGSTANLAYADAAGRAVKAGIVLLAGVVALDQIGIDSTLLILITAIVIGVVLGGLALAFGLGARGVVSNIIASHYMNQAYRVGQRIRVGEVEGRIEEIQPAYLVIDGVEGRVLVPAKQLVETISVLLHEESQK
jgi:small-conductance mechanosensitive channel